MKQKAAEIHSLPGYDALSGNGEARAQADKLKASIDAIYVDPDAMLRAQRNAVLDDAVDRLKDGEKWTYHHLATDEDDIDVLPTSSPGHRITTEMAEIMRDKGSKFCLVGAIGAGLGPHSEDAIQAALSAVSDVISTNPDDDVHGHDYGFHDGSIYYFNDALNKDKDGGKLIVEALKLAKSEPLRRKS